MMATLRYLIFCLFLLGSLTSYSQGVSVSDTARIPASYKPRLERQIRHDAIDREQQEILKSDGKADRNFSPSSSDEINFILTKALLHRTDVLQYLIVTHPGFDHRL